MTRMRPSNTVVVAWLDRFSRNFGEGVRNGRRQNTGGDRNHEVASKTAPCLRRLHQEQNRTG